MFISGEPHTAGEHRTAKKGEYHMRRKFSITKEGTFAAARALKSPALPSSQIL